MDAARWDQEFRQVYNRATAAWKAGRRNPDSLLDAADRAFLATGGCTAQELFDFVDDEQLWGEPDLETAAAVQAIRRRYFWEVQQGQSSVRIARMDDLPAKTDTVEGVAWLPRLMVKARLKLRGEMPPELMYGCGGDRPFLQKVGLTLPGFLQLAWESGLDDRPLIDAVRRGAKRA